MLPVAPTTSTVLKALIILSSLLSELAALGRSRRSGLLDGPQRVERARVPDERQKLGQHIDETSAVVADLEVGRDMALDLRVASANCGEHAEGEKLARRDVDPGPRVVVAETVGRKIALDVQQVG